MAANAPGIGQGGGRYHHGNLREALVAAALVMIAEHGLAGFAIAELARAVGVSPAAPYRHFRDRDAVIAEVARRGFVGLAAELTGALDAAGPNPVHALQRCAQAHLAFAGREAAIYFAMFEPLFPLGVHQDLSVARTRTFAVIRRAAEAACHGARAPDRPQPLMVALHVWSLTHGIAALYVSHEGEARSRLPMTPEHLLNAGLIVYLRALGLHAEEMP